MDYEGLKLFITQDARAQTNYEFVMIKTLSIIEHSTRSSIANDLGEANPSSNEDFNKLRVYDSLVERGIVNESDGMYTLIDFEKFSVFLETLITHVMLKRK